MEKKLFTLKSAHDGLSLSCVMILPEESPLGIVQLCHGMAEHKGRYEDFMTYLAAKGFVTIMHDHRGHGGSIRSEEDLGHFYENGAKGAIQDVLQVSKYAKKEFPGLPLFLFGHSMGSMIVRSYLKRFDNELAGLIVCGSPSANPAAGPGRILCKVIQKVKGERYHSPLLVNLSTGGFGKGLEHEPSPSAWLSYNKDNWFAYDADPLCGFSFTANGYEALMTILDDCYSAKGWNLTNPSLPIHFISGEEDPCMGNHDKFEQAVSFLKKRGYDHVTSKLYSNMRHEILNEDDKESVYQDVVSFLTSCL